MALPARSHARRAAPLVCRLHSCARSVRRGKDGARGAGEARLGLLQHGAPSAGCWRKEREDTVARSAGGCGDCLILPQAERARRRRGAAGWGDFGCMRAARWADSLVWESGAFSE
eukprot:481806-Prymnesium_polylepis.1